MSKRKQLRAQYIEGWEKMDAQMLLSSVSDDFIFDDPAESEAITKAKFESYMPTWPSKARALNAEFAFQITDKVVHDKDGILMEWYWWRLIGTEVEGAAVIKTTDNGVEYEKFAYYKTPWPLRSIGEAGGHQSNAK